ncbi:carbamoyl-phosphate synthase large subunit [Isachenkonia alkalipeptolytica]|uniref:Carbamoyl phosphate synthase large chain n=1 Tax=Isachenkonia alkalipeptolytica TaxID=2565777 RepID=A0AA43XJ93_9CLOT|nr:carbamoyl-phosphate synthase large subunit [Isachenkonia alkalipeptolytica]NBG87767.1 carbamoyl-phosphate synthase large subunit [Isachenkonia alkalipeptolytica]
MSVDQKLKKVVVIGSGPIIVGQAAEFDYAGTQACLALKEEGIEVVLINSNPATIMTDTKIADRVYMEPLTSDFVKKILGKEQPEGLLPTLGGQVALNLAVDLAEEGFLDKEGIKLLGTQPEAIQQAEDRDLFNRLLGKISEPIAESKVVTSLEDAMDYGEEIGYPLIVRPAYTMGGTGGGIAENKEALKTIAALGIKSSRVGQILVERCVAGWKEVEFEVIRDKKDTCIAVCSMENVDPVGVHTGDSIVAAPSQTLANKEYQLLRSASLKIIRALKVEGGCNVQFALDPKSMDYIVIEVNPRVSRSSALASKATGYPIARIAAKIAVGLTLDEIPNPVTGIGHSAFEPSLDYVVVKIPRWPFDKFKKANRQLGTQMKATGEVMALDRSFEGALMKGIRSLELERESILLPELVALGKEELLKRILYRDDERMFYIAAGIFAGISLPWIHNKTGMDFFFLKKIENLVETEKEIQSLKGNGFQGMSPELLKKAKAMNLSDAVIAKHLGMEEKNFREQRKKRGVTAAYHMVDTCAGEFEAKTPYFYGSYGGKNETRPSRKKKVLILGSGPIRIGQGVEFDYCTVHALWTLKELGIESIVINNNPETVSTDYNASDRLYFEPLTPEDVMNVIDIEEPDGVMIQFGGQTAINLGEELAKHGVKILGTSMDSIDLAEDRDKFNQLMESLDISMPRGKTARTEKEALQAAKSIGFPLVIRPSYVLGGQNMEIIYREEELKNYMETSVFVTPRHPVLLDQYLQGMEVEVDAVSDGREVMIPAIMEHMERAGVHSGDSIGVVPPLRLSDGQKTRLYESTRKISRGLGIRGLINLQYVIHGKKILLLEVNPRSSRTVPFLSKVTGIPMINLATKAAMGMTLEEMGITPGVAEEISFYGVKVPVFSFGKLLQVEPSLGPEMKSTGESIGMEASYPKALYKALLASGLKVPLDGRLLVTIADKDKEEAMPLIKGFHQKGFSFSATAGTAKRMGERGIPAREVGMVGEEQGNVLDLIRTGKVDMVINTPVKGKQWKRDGFKIRRAAVEAGIPCITSLDTAKGILEVIDALSLNLVEIQDTIF